MLSDKFVHKTCHGAKNNRGPEIEYMVYIFTAYKYTV